MLKCHDEVPIYHFHVNLESLGGAAALPVSGRDPVMSGKGHGAASMEGQGTSLGDS